MASSKLDPQREAHLRLLQVDDGSRDTASDAVNSPIFTASVLDHFQGPGANRFVFGKTTRAKTTDAPFSQYGVLAGDLGGLSSRRGDPRIFYNVSAPSSVFICGSQGSGKSHSLSCLLENSLIPCEANVLQRPLTGIVFHYDSFVSDTGGSPCEAAYLSSHKDVSVRVLCAPTNVAQIKRIYSHLPKVTIEELRINESDLNTKRMLDLMVVNSGKGDSLPLYLHVIQRILRELRICQQRAGGSFDYGLFKKMVSAEALTDAQLAPLQQRLETLESFMNQEHANSYSLFGRRSNALANCIDGSPATTGNDWSPEAGQLTIVDLSCPCVTADMACSLFGISLSLFLEQQSTTVGRVVALDEAHKFMNSSAECKSLTESLLSTIRLQRHLGARVIISTQEPTISPTLLDLCSVTIVHRFTSPEWLQALKKHLAGASSMAATTAVPGEAAESRGDQQRAQGTDVRPLMLSSADGGSELLSQIISLRPGQALLFSPGAVIGMEQRGTAENGRLDVFPPARDSVVQLGRGVLKVQIRQRVTRDGGQSVMAG